MAVDSDMSDSEEEDTKETTPEITPRQWEWPDLPPKPKKKGLTSRFLNQKTNAEKEIDEWAGVNVKNENLSRMSGQLSDNVTEERMLRSKIIELSKERYKFTNHKEYEKKLFIERSKRRKKMLANSSDKIQKLSDMVSVEEQMEENKKKYSYDRQTGKTGAQSLRRDSKLNGIGTKELSHNPKLSHGHANSMKPIFETQPDATSRSVTFSSDTKPPVRIRPAFLRSKTTLNATQVSQHQPIQEEKAVIKEEPKLSKDKNKKTQKRENNLPTKDSRYKTLERSLSERHEIDKPEEVKHIVTRIAALNIKPKEPKDRKPKLAQQIHEFMRGRGIVF